MITMDLIKDIGVILGVLTALCALFGGLFWGFKYFLELYLKPIEQNQIHIKELLSNHVTGTDKKIDKLDDKVDKLDDKVDKKVEKLEEGQNDLKVGQGKLEAGQNNLDKKIDQLLEKK